MSYLVLARKYRPKNFSEMVGQSHVVQALGNALTTQRLHHAYLFTGTRGVGKTTISRILAKSLNCVGSDGQGGITATPCGVCQACTDIDTGRFVDYTELDAASNRGVDEIAQLLEQAVYKPVVGRFKVFMIDEVHMLTNTAFNAMLKTLEEPPEYLKFVLATTDPQKVPATVLSRCLQFNLRPMAPETVLEHLSHVLAIENVPAEQQALRLLARAARGSMRDALSLTDQAIAFGSGQLQEASVRLMLGSVDRSYVFRLLDALGRGDGKTVVETSEALRLHGLSAASTLEEMTTVLQRMAVLQAVPEMMSKALGTSDGDDDADPEALETARLAQTLPPDETQLLYSLCLHGRGELGLAPDEYAALTMVLLRLLAFKPSRAGSAAEPGKKPQPHPEPAPVRAATVARPSVSHAFEALRAYEAPQTSKIPENSSISEPNVPPAPSKPVQAGTDLIADNKSDLAPAVLVVEELAAEASTETAKTAPTEASAAASTPLGDVWSALVTQMVAADAVGALVRELALQSELRSQAGGVWTLRVERQSLNQSSACEKLQLALQTLMNAEPSVKLAVEVGPITDTPARRNTATQAERQRRAEEVISNDPFVQDMMRNWGARVVPGSIKPVPLQKAKALPI
ncbi:MAG: DNA polymerase III subunit gamma/tau [Polaromonas sp.]|nr:DNA polymerase III subunit gamma/tau [Polaromonas sp.]